MKPEKGIGSKRKAELRSLPLDYVRGVMLETLMDFAETARRWAMNRDREKAEDIGLADWQMPEGRVKRLFSLEPWRWTDSDCEWFDWLCWMRGELDSSFDPVEIC